MARGGRVVPGPVSVGGLWGTGSVTMRGGAPASRPVPVPPRTVVITAASEAAPARSRVVGAPSHAALFRFPTRPVGGTIVRTALVRRTVLTASAVSLALLATACGSSDKDGKQDDTKPGGSSSAPAAPAAKGKTDAELGGLLLVQADLPDHVLKTATADEVKAAAGATSDKAACLPLVKAQSMTAQGASTGTARVKAVAKGKQPAADASPEEKLKAGLDALGATATTVTLESYEAKGAETAFASLKAAGTACASGYAVTQAGEAGKVTKVGPAAAVTAGDEALAYTVEGDADGEAFSTQLVVVRKGNTLATFSALSLAGTAEQPTAVVTAQLKKLG